MEQIPAVPAQNAGPVHTAPALPGVSQLIKEAWELYKQRFWTMIGIVIIPAIVAIGGSIILAGGAASGFALNFDSAVLGGAGIVGLIIFVVLMIAVGVWSEAALITNLANKDENIGIQRAYSMSRSKIGSLLWVNILVGLSIMGGIILLIVPGIIFMFWFSLSNYTAVLEDLKGTTALSKSKFYVTKRWGDVFGRLLVLLILAIILSALAGAIAGNNSTLQNLVSFLFAPFAAAYGLLLYQYLKKV